MNNLENVIYINPDIQNEEIFLHGYDVSVKRGPLRASLAEAEPETARAVIMCEEGCDQPRPHDFRGRRLVSHKGVSMHNELIYQCRSCGQERTWGTEIVEETPRSRERT